MESPPTFHEDFAPPFPRSTPDTQDPSRLSPHSIHHDYNYNNTYDDSSAQSGQDENTDDEMARLNGGNTTSSRSSISSLPVSVSASAIMQPPDAITPTKSQVETHSIKKDLHTLSHGDTTPHGHGSPFRHPSSVRAMQLREDDDFSIAHRRDSQMTRRTSNFSGRSSNTSSSSRRRIRGSQSSPSKQSKLKKEYPLVLLHCTLLPPSISIPLISAHNVHSLEEVLPEEYWRRWKLLNDIIGASEIQTRGILIPHPKGDYELLEERLLESLELAQPRIRSGHYLGKEEDDEGEDSDEDTEQGTKCPDCGRKVVSDPSEDRKWEIKVYAANGLMRAGAWSAAWSEMEKIDVEVGVWLPENIRRDVEAAILERTQQSCVDELNDAPQDLNLDDREREVYGIGGKLTQDDIDGLNDRVSGPEARSHLAGTSQGWEDRVKAPPQPSTDNIVAQFRDLLNDGKNATILFLAILALWLAIVMGPRSEKASLVAAAPIVSTEIVTSTATLTTTEISFATVAPEVDSTTEPSATVTAEVESITDLAT